MAIVLTDDEFVTLDESLGLQNTGVPGANEDNNDDDIVYTDLPVAFSTRLFGAGELNLSSAFAQANGAAKNDFISLTEGSTLTGFVKSDGSPLLAFQPGVTDATTGVEASFTTLDGEKIYLFADVGTELGAFMFLGVDETGDIVLAGYLEADGTISTVQFEAISNPDDTNHDDPVDLTGLLDVAASGTLEFDLDDLPSGNNLFATLGESPTSPAIIIFGADIILKDDGKSDPQGDVMFFSQAGPNATIGMNNQMFNPGDAAFFVYVNNVDANFLSAWPGGLDSTEANDADNALYDGPTLNVTSAKFTIAQIQGNDLGAIQLTTYLGAADEGRELLEGPTDGASSPNITMVKVTIGGTTHTFDSDSDPAVGLVDVSGLGTPTVTILGVDDGYAIEFFTDSVHNRVKIANVEATGVNGDDLDGKFDIGGFVITQGVTIHEPVGDRIVFEDDGPSVGDGEATPGLTVDDSDFATDDSASYAGLFDVDFGTDGGKDSDDNGTVDADAVTYALGVGAGASGLVDTLTGETVVLSIDGLDVVGTISGGTIEVFRISVDANTGEVTLDQSRAVVHDDPEDHEEDGVGEPSKLAAANLITLTATATDDDGDTDDHTVDIGDSFNFEDDGPEMGLSDEPVPDLVTDDTDITDSDSADFSVLFDPDFGNDGAGDPTTYALGVSGADADSGLIDTLTGEAVVLNLVAGEVIGTTALGGEEVLRISVDADGNVTLQQSRAVVHDDPDDHDESASPAKFSAADLVTLTATAYDGDGDHDDAVANIGLAFNFEDDGPTMDLSTAEPPALTTDDTDITDSDTADYSGLFDADFGQDGEASVDGITYALDVSGPDVDTGLVDTLSGEAVVLNLVGGEIVGTTAIGGDEVLRISVDADGNVTLQQSRAVVHDDPEDHDENLSPATFSLAEMVTLTATAYDGDGDHDDAVANIGLTFNFEDDGPAMDLSGAGVPTLVTDDTDITDSDSADFSGLFTPTFGNDGAGAATTYALDVSGPDADSGLVDTLSGEAVVLNLVGGEVIGTTAIGGDEVLRISVDADGNVTLQQSRAVVHDDPEDHEESTSPAMFSAASLVTLTATAYDGDGDHDDAVADIGLAFTFEDDGPAMDLSGAGVPTLVTDDTDITDTDSADFSGLFTPTFGNDGAGAATTYALDVSGADADSGLVDTLSGEAVVLNLVGGEVVGTTAIGGDEVLRISVDADGNVTLQQSRAVVHDDPDDHEESTSPAMFSAASLVTLTATAYDGDGDHDDAVADIGLAFTFEDDGPAMDLSGAGVPSLITDDTDIIDSDSADFSGLFTPTFGNDGEGADTIYALDVSGPDADSGLVDTLSGEAVVLNLVGGEVVGTTAIGGDEVLRISVDADGNVTLQQSRAVEHDDPDDDEESSSPAMFSAASLVTLTATAYDGDGDHDDAVAEIGLAFKFEDDGPSISPNADPQPDLIVDESVFGSVAADFSGLFTTLFGNDGPKDENGDDLPDDDAITYALEISGVGDDTGLIDSLTGEAVVLALDGLDVLGVTELGGLEVFRVSADEETGEVTLTLSRAVKHDDPLDPDEATSPAILSSPDLVKLTATANDGDGDHDSATVSIGGSLEFRDDGPAIGPISDGTVDFADGDTVSNPLGAFPGADGADAKITDFTPSFDFGFGSVVGVQEDDQTVVYYEDENDNGIIDPGEDNAFFQLSLDTSDADPANWSYLFETLADPNPVNIEFDFDNLPSGANLFGVVGESATDPAILVFGKSVSLKADGKYDNASDVIKTSQGGDGATIGVDSQMFDPGDGAYFVYIDDPVANFLSGVPGGLTSTEADDADNVQYTGGVVNVHTASITISQTQGNQPATMKLTTFLGTDEQGRAMVQTPDGTSPNIDSVTVFLLDGTPLVFDADSDPAVNGVDVSGLGTATVVVSGLTRGNTIQWTTDDFHNRVLVEGVAGKFDVGKFSISEIDTVPDAELNFEVTIEDFDTAGDTDVADFTIGIDGDLDGVITV